MATRVFHLRNGGRRVSQGEAVPLIVFPRPVPSLAELVGGEITDEHIELLIRNLPNPFLFPPRFTQEHYELVDYREIAGQGVATYLPCEAPTIEPWVGPAPPWWKRLRHTWREFWYDLGERIAEAMRF